MLPLQITIIMLKRSSQVASVEIFPNISGDRFWGGACRVAEDGWLPPAVPPEGVDEQFWGTDRAIFECITNGLGTMPDDLDADGEDEPNPPPAANAPPTQNAPPPNNEGLTLHDSDSLTTLPSDGEEVTRDQPVGVTFPATHPTAVVNEDSVTADVGQPLPPSQLLPAPVSQLSAAHDSTSRVLESSAAGLIQTVPITTVTADSQNSLPLPQASVQPIDKGKRREVPPELGDAGAEGSAHLSADHAAPTCVSEPSEKPAAIAREKLIWGVLNAAGFSSDVSTEVTDSDENDDLWELHSDNSMREYQTYTSVKRSEVMPKLFVGKGHRWPGNGVLHSTASILATGRDLRPDAAGIVREREVVTALENVGMRFYCQSQMFTARSDSLARALAASSLLREGNLHISVNLEVERRVRLHDIAAMDSGGGLYLDPNTSLVELRILAPAERPRTFPNAFFAFDFVIIPAISIPAKRPRPASLDALFELEPGSSRHKLTLQEALDAFNRQGWTIVQLNAGVPTSEANHPSQPAGALTIDEPPAVDHLRSSQVTHAPSNRALPTHAAPAASQPSHTQLVPDPAYLANSSHPRHAPHAPRRTSDSPAAGPANPWPATAKALGRGKLAVAARPLPSSNAVAGSSRTLGLPSEKQVPYALKLNQTSQLKGKEKALRDDDEDDDDIPVASDDETMADDPPPPPPAPFRAVNEREQRRIALAKQCRNTLTPVQKELLDHLESTFWDESPVVHDIRDAAADPKDNGSRTIDVLIEWCGVVGALMEVKSPWPEKKYKMSSVVVGAFLYHSDDWVQNCQRCYKYVSQERHNPVIAGVLNGLREAGKTMGVNRLATRIEKDAM
ncbi:hypothetical protein C8Q76DRAFT_832426 [Earliella scabrosa]|nr:hypothetical protein C8Q76DRAFT_832426 [Earliella scabrosa]